MSKNIIDAIVHPIPSHVTLRTHEVIVYPGCVIPTEFIDLPRKFSIAATVGRECLSKRATCHPINYLINVSSLPNREPHWGGFRLASLLKLNVAHILNIGLTCSALLDALYLTFLLNSYANLNSLIVIADSFEDYIDNKTLIQKPKTKEWRDGAAAMNLGKSGHYSLRLLSYVSICDGNLHALTNFSEEEDGYKLRFNNNVYKKFNDLDIPNDLKVINKSLKEAKIQSSEIDAFILTNRQESRRDSLLSALKLDNHRIFSSRKSFGHRGGVDILHNLNLALQITLKDKTEANFLLSGNGLGYCWSAMVLRVGIK